MIILDTNIVSELMRWLTSDFDASQCQ